MDKCDQFELCPFYQGSIHTAEGAEPYKQQYCHSNNLHCALYMIIQAKGIEAIPDDILPNEKDKAFAIISS